MASSITLQTCHGTVLRSNFLGQSNLSDRPHKPYSLVPKELRPKLKTCAKFNLFELMGGRGLCNGEEGLQQELKRKVQEEAPPTEGDNSSSGEVSETGAVPEDAFEKEMMGLTGGFPGGEKGLKNFIEENPPPKKKSVAVADVVQLTTSKKPKPPELPLLMPGMIAIVKNPNNPYYMYCGIVQRITDGKAGVLFEGGNWDRLITFELEELERREKGPPGKNPKSVIIEKLIEAETQ